MFDYRRENNWNYAAPECQIEVQNPSKPLSKNCMVIVDSGADMTCVPESIISELGNLSKSKVIMRNANGDTVEKDTFVINIQISNYEFSQIEVIPIPKKHGLLGRDIINKYKISLNAPSDIWGIDCQGDCNYRS